MSISELRCSLRMLKIKRVLGISCPVPEPAKIKPGARMLQKNLHCTTLLWFPESSQPEPLTKRCLNSVCCDFTVPASDIKRNPLLFFTDAYVRCRAAVLVVGVVADTVMAQPACPFPSGPYKPSFNAHKNHKRNS